MLCQCGAVKNGTAHSNDCPVTLGMRLDRAKAVIAAQKAVIANLELVISNMEKDYDEKRHQAP